jgi:hypothetical protein
VCCNDSTVKVFALPSMSAVTVLRCPCPINYVALSPDGTTLVAVGDCDPTYLYQTTPSGGQPGVGVGVFTGMRAAVCEEWLSSNISQHVASVQQATELDTGLFPPDPPAAAAAATQRNAYPQATAC